MAETRDGIRYRIYRYKFYLDARHYIYDVGGEKGLVHPHTWEFAVELATSNGDFVPFNEIENVMGEVLQPYQDNCLNELAPFDGIVPTMENIGEYFREIMAGRMRERGWDVLRMEISETPSRSYVMGG